MTNTHGPTSRRMVAGLGAGLLASDAWHVRRRCC